MSSGEGLAGQRHLRADARRNMEKVVEAAAEVFARDGLDVPLEDIARRAGVRAGTIYNRFGGREGLTSPCNDMSESMRLSSVLEHMPSTVASSQPSAVT